MRVLRDRYPDWAKESLDGVFVARARKTGSAAAELVGTCILISEQTVTPFLFALVLSPSGASIESYEVRIGEPGGGPLATRLDRIAWSSATASDDR